ncbi:hypothetical protein [Spiroplasma endosymbiont of Labia minor]|uniref:hypothetical protein n=1 Tax=Spiroplasma endosymbiont of Labia minor TaxID=3066305 RepID=UPI0030D08D3B
MWSVKYHYTIGHHQKRHDYYLQTIIINNVSLNLIATTNSDSFGHIGYNRTDMNSLSFDSELFNNNSNQLSINGNLSQNVKNILDWVFPTYSDELDWNTFLKNSWMGLTIDFKNAFMNLLADKIQSKLTETSNDDIILNHFKQDWIYKELTNNEYFSLDSSKKYFEENILTTYSQYQNGQKFSIAELSSNIEMTYDEWLNDFYYLDTTNSELTLNEMWFVGNNNDTRITFSDVIGNNIASSIEGAKNIRAQKDNSILYKEYILYDTNVQELMISLDEDQAIEQLKNNINPTFRYVNKNELKKLQNNISRFTDIVSDGLYTIYRFKIDDKNYVYYNSYENALAMYENKENLIVGITKISKLFYVYSTIVNGSIKNITDQVMKISL